MDEVTITTPTSIEMMSTLLSLFAVYAIWVFFIIAVLVTITYAYFKAHEHFTGETNSSGTIVQK